MAPSADLRDLALAKSALRLRIACRRIRCADALVHAARPLVWLDEAQAARRRLTPLFVLIFSLWKGPKSGLVSLARLLLRLMCRRFTRPDKC